MITVDLAVTILDLSVVEDQTSLFANQAGATYQWIDCASDLPVENGTSQTFQPMQNGEYAVIIDYNGCTDTSTCFAFTTVGLEDSQPITLFRVYPNPVRDFFRVECSRPHHRMDIEILDVLGRIQYKVEYHESDWIFLPPDTEAGVFFIKAVVDGVEEIFPILVQ